MHPDEYPSLILWGDISESAGAGSEVEWGNRMKKGLSTEQNASNITKVMALLTETPARLSVLSRTMSAARLHLPLGKEERSFIEVLAHLVNSEARTSDATYLALLRDEPLIDDIHPERELGKLLRYDLVDFPDLLAYFKTRRKVLLRVLSGLTDAQWARSAREEGKKRKESVYWRVRALALHESEHLDDLERKLRR